jgi:RNA recognition motif-containing protein
LTRQIVARSMLQRTGAAVTVLPSVYLLQRGMASSKLFIGGLAWGTDEQTLKEAFSSFGEVLDGTEASDSNPVSLLSKIGEYHSFYVFFSRFVVLSSNWMMMRFYFLCSQDHL